MASLIVTLFQLVACAYILTRGAFVLNRMSRHTAEAMRYAYLVMTTGAAYGIVTAFNHPNLSATLIACGVALFMHGEKRNVFQ